jgi:ATP-binding cassette subfamily F protein uup
VSACSIRNRRCHRGSCATRWGTAGKGRPCCSAWGWASCSTRAPTSSRGGQVKRVALATLLAAEHEALILDEPTNHLDLDAIAFLEEWLAASRSGLVMVTHDRHVLDRVTTRVLELDRGRGYLHVPANRHSGSGYAAYLEGRAEREEQAETDEQNRRNLAKRELAWLRRGAPARSTKPKARVAAATAVVNARADAPARDGELSLSMGSQRLGSKGVELRKVSFAYPSGASSGAQVLSPLSLTLEPGDRIGIVGPNGAGKTTLLDLIAGRLQPTGGTVERGATVKVGYHDQLGRDLDGDQRVRDAVAGDKGQPSLADVSLMRRFWFDGDAQFAPIRLLSGGERRRLQLLLTLVEQPNVLLLDEPTNDLDLDTLRALEDLLDDWPGIVVTVSHDRSFIDRTVDQLLALDGRGGVRPVRGGVAGWMAERAAGPSAAPAQALRSTSRAAPAPQGACARAVPEHAPPAPARCREGPRRSDEDPRCARHRDRRRHRAPRSSARLGEKLAPHKPPSTPRRRRGSRSPRRRLTVLGTLVRQDVEIFPRRSHSSFCMSATSSQRGTCGRSRARRRPVEAAPRVECP